MNILITLAIVWCAGIIIAPFFAGTWFSDGLYRWYSNVCHQFGSRSFHLHEHPFAVCVRCTSIYAAFLSTLITIRFSIRLRTISARPIILLLIACIPLFIDGMLSLFHIVESTTVSRVVTGSLFGAGIALLMHSVLCETIQSFLHSFKRNHELKTR